MNLDYSTDLAGGNINHLMIGPDATADAGFITRTDIRRTDGHIRLSPRPKVLGLRKLDLFSTYMIQTRVDGLMQDWAFGAALNPNWNSGESLMLYYGFGFNRIDESFELGDDVDVPAGDYDLWQLMLFANTSSNRPVVFSAQNIFQGTFGGHMLSASGTLTVKPNANVSVEARYNRNYVDVPDGSFTADVASVRLAYAFSTRLIANTLLQYNNLDNSVSANVRINFIHSPGSDLYIVFNERRGDDDGLWTFNDRGAVLKLTYLARF
jgi:hypothetical protein